MTANKLLLVFFLACSTWSATAIGTTTLADDDKVSWLTILGSPGDPDVDTILIDPTPSAVKGHMRWMNLRLNRAKTRTSTDGIVFRSFVSVIEFDCDKRSARFTKTQFYNDPLWASPGRAMDYPAAMVRPMAFREIEPNPSERVIRAACSTVRPAAAAGSKPQSQR